MTEALSKISRAKETGKKNASDFGMKQGKVPKHAEERGKDCIDISEEARERAAGKKHGNILDYLNEEAP
jgi:hypothetical protein